MKRHFILIVALFITTAASSQDSLQKTQISLQTIEELKLLNVLWQQNAAEYRALCYQAFNTAIMRLNEIPRKKFKKEHFYMLIKEIGDREIDQSIGRFIKIFKQLEIISTKRRHGNTNIVEKILYEPLLFSLDIFISALCPLVHILFGDHKYLEPYNR